MADLPHDISPPSRLPADRLESWKEIAAYLSRDVTTAQRWERREAMPVHRHVHGKLGTVYAFRSELDVWMAARRAPAVDRADARPGSEPALAEVEQSAAQAASRRWWPLAAVAALAGIGLLLAGVQGFRSDVGPPSDPLADARFEYLTESDGTEQAAALSPDGRFVAFQSDRDGRMDVWITSPGSTFLLNLTRGRADGIVNNDLRTLGFSPDGTDVLFWARSDGPSRPSISVWAVPIAGGPMRPYLEGAAELAWTPDGRLVYHTPDAGDPLFLRRPKEDGGTRIFAAAAGQHAHFPTLAPGGDAVFVVQGDLPAAMDLWRIALPGGTATRLTSHRSRVSHPTVLDRRTLLYLATDADGAGPWLYALDLLRGGSRRVSGGLDRYTSLSASADGSRLVVTAAHPRTSLWEASLLTEGGVGWPTRIDVPSVRGESPRVDGKALLYVVAGAAGDAIWKLSDGGAAAIWTGTGARVVGRPAIAPRGHRLAFVAEESGRTRLVVMNADGSGLRVIDDRQRFRGDPAWDPNGASLVVAADRDGVPGIVRIRLADGASTLLVAAHAVDPVWSPDGRVLLYSGPNIGTTFEVKAVTADGAPYPIAPLTLSRGARRLRFLDPHTVILMRGELEHKDFWVHDIRDGSGRRLTELDATFAVHDFDVDADGQRLVFDRFEPNSDIVLIDRVGAKDRPGPAR